MKYREMREATKLLRANTEWPAILARFDNRYTEEHIKREIERDRLRFRHRDRPKHSNCITLAPVKPLEIPREVLTDRDHRLNLVPDSITACVCNDPLPGYSALDRRKEAEFQ